MQGKHHEFLLLFSFFSPSQLNYTLSLHSSLRSLIPHQIIPICKYTSAFSFPFISSFDWGLFEGLNCVLNILFPKNHCQLPYRSVLSLSSCSQLKHTYCPHAKAVLLCHIASLFCLYPKENPSFQKCRSAPLGSLPDFCQNVVYWSWLLNTSCFPSLPYQASLLPPFLALCLFHEPQVRYFSSKLLVAYCAVKRFH